MTDDTVLFHGHTTFDIFAQEYMRTQEIYDNPGLNGIWTHELCDTGAVLHQLSYVANSAWLR